MKDSFGTRLKFFRSKAGFSQQYLADITGLSRKIISDYEVKLDIMPRDSNLYKIADALNIDSSNLIPKTDDNGQEDSDGGLTINYNLNEFPKRMVEIIKGQAKKNNTSVQDEFNLFMQKAIQKLINTPREERKLKENDKDQLEINEDLYKSYLERNGSI